MGRTGEWALEIKKDEHENQAGWKHLKNATVKEALSLIETAEDRDIAKFLDFTKSEIKTMVKNFNIKEDDLLIPLFISISQDYLSPKLDQIEKKFFDLIKQGLNEQEISKKLCVSTAKVIVVVKIIIARILLGLFDYYRPYKSVESYEFLDSAGSVNTLAIEGYEDVFVIHSGHNFLEINTKGKVLTKIEGNYYCRVTKNSSIVTDIKGKCGLIDNQGNYIIKPEYISLEPILPCEDNKYFIAARPDKYGIINKYGKVKIDFKYDEFGYFDSTHDYICAKLDGKWGVIDYNDNVIIPFIYEESFFTFMSPFEKLNCFPAQKEDKSGVINLKNEVIIPFEYDYIGQLLTDKVTKNVTWAEKNSKRGVINIINNETVIPFDYDYIEILSDETIFVNSSQGGYIVDYSNEKVCDTNFAHIGVDVINDSEYYHALVNGKFGIIDKYGKIKIDFKYDDQLRFLNENLLITEKNSRTGIIDINENVIVPFEYRNFSYDVRTNTICASKVIDDKIKYGLINLKNEVLIDFKFNDLYYLCNGYLFAKDDFSWMCIDQKGNPIKIECDCNVC